ncbi:MAG: hypothetical protein HWN65_16090 [Candidatus Helarchaeota archaeon]|nr:hypothetical protein [Candidatus Helarchaeota archaeon]
MVYTYLSYTAMGLGFIIIAVYFYFFIIILNKARTARNQGMEVAPFVGLALMFLFFALIRLFLNYYEFNDAVIIFYTLAALFGYLFFISFIFVTEMILKKTKYILTAFCLILCIYGIIFFKPVEDLRLYTQITLPILAVILLSNYLIILVLKTTGNIRRKLGIGLFVLVLAFFFYVLDTSVGPTFFLLSPEASPIIARTGLLVSGLVLGYIFVSFETFTELDWPKKLKDLFIIYKSGVNLFHFSFIREEHSPNPQLISAGLSGIKAFISRMMRSEENLKIVDHENLKLIFEYGKYATSVLVVSENLHIYHLKLANLMNQFENLFQDILPDWIGEIEQFLPTKHLVKQVFELEEGEAIVSRVGLIGPLVRRFFIFSIILLLVPVSSGFLIYFLNLFLWQPIMIENWMLSFLIILTICLGIIIPTWFNYRIFQKIDSLKSNIKDISHKLLTLLILCASISIISLIIYLLYANVLWSATVWVVGVIEFVILMIIGISLIERLERTKPNFKK